MRRLFLRPPSTDDMHVESESVTLLSHEDGSSTIIEKIIFICVQLTTDSNEKATSLSTYPLTKQDASNPSDKGRFRLTTGSNEKVTFLSTYRLTRQDAYNTIVQPTPVSDCMVKSNPSDKGNTLGGNVLHYITKKLTSQSL